MVWGFPLVAVHWHSKRFWYWSISNFRFTDEGCATYTFLKNKCSQRFRFHFNFSAGVHLALASCLKNLSVQFVGTMHQCKSITREAQLVSHSTHSYGRATGHSHYQGGCCYTISLWNLIPPSVESRSPYLRDSGTNGILGNVQDRKKEIPTNCSS